MVNKAIFSAVEEQWRKEIQSSTTLKYINPDSIKVGRAHHVWSSVRNNVHDSRRSHLKCRVLTGTYYTLQSNRAVFNQLEQCPETRQHFLTECQTLHIRRNFCSRIQDNVKPGCDITSPDQLTQLILDPSVLHTNYRHFGTTTTSAPRQIGP